MQDIDLFILAGEPSGDRHGAKLIEELLSLDPRLQIAAVAGPCMRKFPIECIEPMESLAVMGFTDVLFSLPKIMRLFFRLRKIILERSPKAFIGIDYPGFNLRMHRSLKKHNFSGKLIHYICPTVWAWGKKRIPQMAKTLDQLLTILPFEPACFAHTTLAAEYIGHPLTESILAYKPDLTFRSRYGFQPTDRVLALFPGSRKVEVERNLPLMLETARNLSHCDPHLKIAISAGHPTANHAHHCVIPLEDTYALMQEAHLALAKSGTVVLELALHRTPTIVQYAIRPFDVFLATKIFKIKLPYYSIANLILQQEVFPELFGPQLTPGALQAQAEALWFSEERRNSIRQKCGQIWDVLGKEPASKNAAKQILCKVFS